MKNESHFTFYGGFFEIFNCVLLVPRIDHGEPQLGAITITLKPCRHRIAFCKERAHVFDVVVGIHTADMNQACVIQCRAFYKYAVFSHFDDLTLKLVSYPRYHAPPDAWMRLALILVPIQLLMILQISS